MRGSTVAVLLALLVHAPAPVSLDNINIVKQWALNLGKDLWDLNKALTKSDEIIQQYKIDNASVKKKDGKQILDSSLRSVSTMLTRKINAVKCIHAKAKQLAKEFDRNSTDDFKYCSAKYSDFIYETGEPKERKKEKPLFAQKSTNYLNVSLEKDSHFYEINVTTNDSCVHVPTNIFYLEEEARNAIIWTEGLTEIFINNYKSDPSLAWQYFGTSQGVLRFYPGMPWNEQVTDEYDCRVRTWYIEAATCSKEVIILFDVSGSMTGFKNYVARRTLKSLLSTLSNNDYVNVYAFKKHTEEAVDCFKDLVQATPENKKTIENTLEPKLKSQGDEDSGIVQEQYEHKIPLDGNANLTEAYIKAFTALRDRRKNCSVSSQQGCNQMVMVITDYVPGNLSEVFDEYNRQVIDNKTYIPVRVFTYLVGKEVLNVGEIQSMACSNRGYFVHIHSVEEVQQQVLKYINVIARPMILSGEDPPPTWTHANIDETRTNWMVSGEADRGKPDEDKLVTSVAIPAFDSDESNENATLLGVAGTDVPIDDIAKLAQPHQLGVNGYPLIVSNNGYLLLHPLLIATLNGNLQDNFNSVDFVEVEQVDDGKGPRELGPEIQTLRENLVNGIDGSMRNVKVLYHYDSMRRIAQVEHDYFFNKLNGTPFSMGISLPVGYGDTELMLRNNPLEITYPTNITGVNVTNFFRRNFRVHPDWVYCKYHYLEGHEAVNAENEIWKFLVESSHDRLNISKTQYSEKDKETTFNFETHCGEDRAEAPGKDDYYCTEDLVKQLVFDAKLTTPYFDTKWSGTEREESLVNDYNVSVRFIATSSGLTKWDYIFDSSKNEYVNDDGIRERNDSESVFGDVYHNSIEEVWYKAAVLQHMVRADSLVVSTNLPILDETIEERPPVENPDGDITVTVTYALFYKDGNYSTPASVVGFQYSYLNFLEKFTNSITSQTEKDFSCEKYYCYVVDSSGYVVLSVQAKEEVGQFFGALNRHTQLVMQRFIDRQVYKSVEVFNYQALCPTSALQATKDGAWSFTTPFATAGNLLRWLLTELLFLIFNWNQYVYATDYDQFIIPDPTTTSRPVENDTIKPINEEEHETFSCDHSITLYILDQNNTAYTTVHEDNKTSCSPPYWASYVKNTNLLLVVIDPQEVEEDYELWCITPQSTAPNNTMNSTQQAEPCHKLALGNMTRRPLEGCFTYNEKENNITLCGGGSNLRRDLALFLPAVLLVSLASRLLTS